MLIVTIRSDSCKKIDLIILMGSVQCGPINKSQFSLFFFNYILFNSLTFVFCRDIFQILTYMYAFECFGKKSHTLRFVAVTHRPINRPSY